MATLKQKTSFGPGIYRGHVFSVDRLKAFVDGTNRAIQAGVPIPLLKRHAPINASDDDTTQFAKEEGSGWVTKVELEPDGSIAFEADNVPDEAANGVKSGTLKFTSPEFRPHYECEKAGVYSGPVIRHFAFTPTPGNPHQGAIEVVALSEMDSCIQLSEEDYQGPLSYGEGVENDDIWNKAKEAAGPEGKKYKGDSYWAVVSSIYKKMGGKYMHKDSQHSEGEAKGMHVIFDNTHEGSRDSKDLKNLIESHGGMHHKGNAYSFSKSKVAKFKKEAKSMGFNHGEHYDTGHYDEDTQHAELSPVEAPSINATKDSQYKDKGVKYPKHDEDAADDPDHDVNNELGEGSEGNSVDDEELVDGETKPKKKKGTTNKGEDVNHDQEMDKDTNKLASKTKEDVDTQHMEDPSEASAMLSKYGYKYKGKGGKGHPHVFEHSKGHEVAIAGGNSPDLKHFWTHTNANRIAVEPKGHKTKEGNGLKDLESHLSKFHSSQHAEKDSDGFCKPENDEPNAPAKETPNDPNLEVAEVEEPVNPDMPPKATDKTKLAAILAGFNTLGLVLPSDWDPANEASMDILLGCLNTHIKTEQDAEAEENTEPEEGAESPKDAPMPFSEGSDVNLHHGLLTDRNYKLVHGSAGMGGANVYKHKKTGHLAIVRQNGSWEHIPGQLGHENATGKSHRDLSEHLLKVHGSGAQYDEEDQLQFSEEELEAMPAKARKVIEAGQAALKAEREARIKAEQEAVAFAEQEKLTRAMSAKGKAIAEVTAACIPPALKRKLLESYQTIQFSEAKDEPVFTGEQVAKMVADAIPPSLQFMEIETAEGVKPSVSIPVGKDPITGDVVYRQITDSEQFFEKSGEVAMSKERANEIANSTTARMMTFHANQHTFTPTVPLSQSVARENERVPNNVMNR